MQPVTFVTRLSNVLANLDRNAVKAAIGDSTDNNRTLTASQVVRFLTSRRRRSLRQLGNHLSAVKASFAYKAKYNRYERGAYRTDAIDIYELLTTVNSISRYPEINSYSYERITKALKRA